MSRPVLSYYSCFLLAGFLLLSTYTFAEETRSIDAVAELRSGDSITCSGLAFREMKLHKFQFWTQPNLGESGFWTDSPLEDIQSIRFGDFGRDKIGNHYVKVTIVYFNGRTKEAYTGSSYRFYYPDDALPSQWAGISLSEIRSMVFSTPKSGRLCEECNKRFYNDEWKYCPYCGRLLRIEKEN